VPSISQKPAFKGPTIEKHVSLAQLYGTQMKNNGIHLI